MTQELKPEIALARCVVIAQALREGSYDHEQLRKDVLADSNDSYYADYYRLSITQAATQACSGENAHNLYVPLSLLLTYAWNDVNEWAEVTLLSSGMSHEELTALVVKYDPLYGKHAALIESVYAERDKALSVANSGVVNS